MLVIFIDKRFMIVPAKEFLLRQLKSKVPLKGTAELWATDTLTNDIGVIESEEIEI